MWSYVDLAEEDVALQGPVAAQEAGRALGRFRRLEEPVLVGAVEDHRQAVLAGAVVLADVAEGCVRGDDLDVTVAKLVGSLK